MDLLSTLAAQAEQVEVFEMQSETTTVEFESNKLKASRVEQTSGSAVRIMRNGRLGFSASTDGEAANRLASNVMESAAYGDQIPLRFPGPLPASTVRTFDPTIASFPIPRLVEIGQQAIEMLRSEEPEAHVNVWLNRGVQKASIRTQAGADIAFERSPLIIGVEMSRVRNDDVLLLGDVLGATVAGEDLLTPARNTLQKLQRSRRITTIRSGTMPVLFSPTGALALILPLLEGLNGLNVYKGTSPMTGRAGQQLFDAKLTVMDDATLDGRFASAPYDDEGIPHRCNALIEGGVLRGFLYDLKTAAQAGAESTGNGMRELFRPPGISPTNLVMAAGDHPVQEIISDIDEGLLVEDVLALGMGNILSGAFSNPLALAFKIEKGEIVGRVKDVSIAGNIYDLLRSIADLSRERAWAYNTFCAPYILLPEMNVVSKN